MWCTRYTKPLHINPVTISTWRGTTLYTNFDYVRDTDHNFFIVLGDKHTQETITALPVFAPDPNGGRLYEDMTLAKQPKDGSAALAGEPYQQSTVRFGALEIERDRIAETVSPYRDKDAVIDNMNAEKQAVYRRINEYVDDELMVIGSDTFGLATDSSDLDVVWLGDYDRFQDVYRDVLQDQAGFREVDDDWLEDRIVGHADRYREPEPVSAYHHTVPQQRFFDEETGIKVGFSPSQVPGTWTDFYRLEQEEAHDVYHGTGTVVDADRNGCWPRSVALETGEHGEMELVTYFWAYGGSFEEGDEVAVHGDLFQEADTIYLRERGHYAAPLEVFRDE